MALGTATLWLPPGSAHIVLALGFGGIHLALGANIVRHHGG
jgi:phage protein D